MFWRDAHYISLRYSCTNWKAIAPSPTAEATRFTDPERTSPAANTPGRLVSSRNGGRAMLHDRDCERAAPVRTNPFASRSISEGSQSVRGVAPIKLNTAGATSSEQKHDVEICCPHCGKPLTEAETRSILGQFAQSKRLSSLGASRFAKMTPNERSAENRRIANLRWGKRSNSPQ
jgi:hypothetical protein